jgi:hypothetical protein
MTSIERRKADLRAEIETARAALESDLARKERYLAALENMPPFEDLANGTVMALVVTYGRSRPYVVIGYKVRGLWYATGDKSPNGVSSDSLAEWLVSSGRRLERAEVLAEIEAVTLSVVDLGALLEARG